MVDDLAAAVRENVLDVLLNAVEWQIADIDFVLAAALLRHLANIAGRAATAAAAPSSAAATTAAVSAIAATSGMAASCQL